MTEEINVDAIVNEAMAPETSPEVPTEGIVNDASAETEQTQETSKEAEGSRVLKYKGEELSMDDDRYRNYAQKGYDYEKKMHQQRVDRKLFDQEREAFKAKYDELEQINEYAKANPQFERLIQEQWALIQSGQTPQMEPQTEVQVLKSQMNTLMEQMNAQKDLAEKRRVAEMEASQEGTIAKYKEDHSQFDWATKDEDGFTLEDRIGNAMIDNGVKNFQIMADSFLLKEHMSRKTLEGKESAAKDIQKANHLGLGKVTKRSQLGVKKTEDISKKSYDDLIKEGLADLGIEY